MCHLSKSLCLLMLLVCPGFADEPKQKADSKPAADSKLTSEKAMAEAITRWNKVADGVKVGTFTFIWEVDRFPHPTFRLGSDAAYGAFARILLKFLEEKGNFEFLTENILFSAKLRYVYAGGKDANVDWTLGKLVSDLAKPDSIGDHDETTRKALKGYADKIAKKAAEREK